MGFFERNRSELAERGIDPSRLPPGQYHTDRFPVLHVGEVPDYPDLSTWTLRVWGLVGHEVTLSWADLQALPTTTIKTDIHCVTKWSKFDTTWEGVRIRDVLDLAGIRPEATHVLTHAEFGYTSNLPLADLLADDALLAYRYDGEALEPVHGYPVRSLVPKLYLWKSVKWIRGFELLDHDQRGFWENNGYHDYGDPWREQRHWGD
jgi:DMSO/TMAO reductase YedYZ molybdopterin-dependent catalytic subunit